MLKVQNRLKRKKDFETVFKKGRNIKEGFLIFKFVKSDLAHSRIGFMVGKKISKKAVIRNGVQRKLKAQTALMLRDIKDRIDGIFIAMPGIERRKSKEIQETIGKIFKKAGII